MGRVGSYRNLFGLDDKSWSLFCTDRRFALWHKNRWTIPFDQQWQLIWNNNNNNTHKRIYVLYDTDEFTVYETDNDASFCGVSAI